jgi:hypothetical protein
MKIEQLLRIGRIMTPDEVESANRDYESARRAQSRSNSRRTGRGVLVVTRSEEN